jgi:hypothetical protein
MRNSDYSCTGECSAHGKWHVRIEFLGTPEIVEDECPRCVLETLIENAGDELEAAFTAGYTEGFNAAGNSPCVAVENDDDVSAGLRDEERD